MSLTVLRAFITSWWIRPAYCTVLGLSSVVLMGIPGKEGNEEVVVDEDNKRTNRIRG